MKKIISILLSFSIVFLSVSTCIPISVCADTDKTVLSKSSDSPFAYSSSEAQKYVSAHLDIYDSDNTLLFSYTPTSTYNWTYSAKGKDNLHLSDNQLKAFLMSKKTLSAYVQLMFSGFSNNNVTRGFLSALGIVTTGNSNALTDVSDKLLGNYNYIDSINYDEDTQTITMDNTSVDKLREEIKKYYYNSIGLKEKKSSGTVSSIIDSSDFRACFEYEEDYVNAFGYKNYNYCLKTYYGFYYFFNDLSDYIYVSNDSNNDRFLSSYDNWTKETWRFRTLKTDGTTGYFQPVKENTVIRYDFTLTVNVSDMYFWYTPSNGDWVLRPDWNNDYSKWVSFYSKDNSSLKFWASYSALYNYLHGDQNAYLSSTIEKTGEDITFSIKDMNENLGNKMDALIDSINSNKSNMSSDELQSAIDKGLEDLNKNTEDIKDNTSDILDVLREQNQILLDILGVTTNIYKVVKESDSKEKTYNINYVQSVFNSMFKGLKNAVLYGENTVRNDVSEDTDDIDSIVSDIPPDKKNYHNGLFGRFPFSVPYQLFDWLQALYVDPVAPKFTLSYAYLFKDLGYETNNFEFVIDLGDEKYSKWIELVRSGEKLSFIIYMAIATYHRFKNEI